MITGAVLLLLGAILDALASLLPTYSFIDTSAAGLPSWVTSGTPILTFLDAFAPVSEMVNLMTFVALYALPATLAYRSTNWVYRHIPLVGGG